MTKESDSVQKTDNRLIFDGELSDFDRQVYSAVCSMYKGYPTFAPEEILMIINKATGNSLQTQQMLASVIESVDKMREMKASKTVAINTVMYDVVLPARKSIISLPGQEDVQIVYRYNNQPFLYSDFYDDRSQEQPLGNL